MNIQATPIPDLMLLAPRVFEDDRGYFYESYNRRTLAGLDQHYDFVQDNESLSSRGVLRGLHYQQSPMGQAKLVRVTRGEVLDVAVDIRPESPTYGQSYSVLLSQSNKKQLLIPRGFAHGFVVLSDTAVFAYKCDNYYSKEHDRGIDPFDPVLRIDWRMEASDILLSEKDRSHPSFGQHEEYIIAEDTPRKISSK